MGDVVVVVTDDFDVVVVVTDDTVVTDASNSVYYHGAL